MGQAEEIQPPAREVRWENRLRGLGQPVQGIHRTGTVERGRESLAPVPLVDRGSADVLHGTAGTREDGLQH